MIAKIAVIGSGFVGEELIKAFTAKGYDVRLASRDPQGENAQRLASQYDLMTLTLAEAIAWADLLTLAIPGSAVRETVSAIPDWQNKIVIDATNHFGGGSASEAAEFAHNARVVKALNTIGAELYSRPDFDGIKATMFYCGDHEDAKAQVQTLIETLGFEPLDVGPINNAELIAPLVRLWVTLSRTSLGREIAFKLLRRT
ncbi:MAG: NAD(P)-binding domain-containing protein [Anaerolineae bacterium]|jgi:hypothetical protein|nr:NAD(P)-binding domain-containing protein [Anaerolineae bacterium]